MPDTPTRPYDISEPTPPADQATPSMSSPTLEDEFLQTRARWLGGARSGHPVPGTDPRTSPG
jgi:hypothetical protein